MHRTKSFFVGQWQIEPALNRITCGDEQIQLVPKVMALLLVLVEYHGEPLSQDRLIELVWPGQVVSDSSVYQAVAQLRKALGDSGTKKIYIERVSGKGYRLIAPINEDNKTAGLSPPPPPPSSKQPPLLGLLVAIIVAIVVSIGGMLWWGQKPDSADKDFAIDRIASITLVDLQTESAQQFAKLDALNQVLLTQLMQIQAMKVVHHQSPDKLVDTQVVMTGKINQQDALIRVYLQMQLAQTGEVIWAQLFEGELNNLFALQDSIVDTLLGLFKRGQVSPAFDSKSVEQRSFDQYLLALHLWDQRQTPQLQQAQQIFESMRQREQLFPLAAVGLCNTYHFLHIYSDWTLAQALEKCQPLLEQALKTQPDLGQALAAKARLLNSQGKQLEARAMFEKALKQAPNYAFGYMWYGNLVRDLGDYDEALAMTQKAYQLSPMSPIVNRSLAYSHLNLSQLSDARYYFERALTLEPHYSKRPVAELEFLSLNVTRAIAFMRWAKQHPKLIDREPYHRLTQVQIKLALGDIAVETLLQALQEKKINPAFSLYMKASVQAASGDIEGALALLKQRLEMHKDRVRFVMPYLSVLYYLGNYEQVYQTLAELKPKLSKGDVVIDKDNQYLVAFYVRLQFKRGQPVPAGLVEKLDQWFATSTPKPNHYLAGWLVDRGQLVSAKLMLLALMKDGWLPDFNEDMLAEYKMRALFVAVGLDEAVFDGLLAENRARVVVGLTSSSR